MNKRNFLLAALLIICQFGFAQKTLVKNIAELDGATKQAKPGDIIVMKNGEWKDAAVVLTCEGTSEKPVTIMAETDGQVKLTGTSSLQIGGKHIVVQGLNFTEGYSPLSAVIIFKAKGKLATNCRVTNTSITDYNKPKRMDDDYWITFSGQNNRLDHCNFVDKKTMGVLLAVELSEENSRKNFHSIDHNYFGRRLPLGNNSGEIIRIGNSQHALFYSNTQITNNLFEECDGEAEVISVKSCGNLVRNNIFKKCQGSVVLRHGNDNRVEGNLFLGMGKESTGGVRIINEEQVIINNFFYQVKGESFRAPLTIMNGVPNSPPIRYVTVRNALIANNTFVECSPMSFGEGSDAERNEAPKNVFFFNNAFYNPPAELFYSHDKTDSIFFAQNATNNSRGNLPAGFEIKRFNVSKLDHLSFPTATAASLPNTSAVEAAFKNKLAMNFSTAIGATPAMNFQKLLDESNKYGVTWLTRTEIKTSAASMKIKCSGINDLQNLQEIMDSNVRPGGKDVLIELTGTSYKLKTPLVIKGNVVITQSHKKPVSIISEKSDALFIVSGGARLVLRNVNFDLSKNQTKHFILTDTAGSANHLNITCTGSSFANQQNSGNGSFIFTSKASFADSIVISDCRFVNNMANLLSANTENEDKGIYNAEKIRIVNNSIVKQKGAVLNIYRGGVDESTLGPDLLFTNNKLMDCTADEPLIKLTGIQKTNISNNVFSNSNKGKLLIQYKDKVRARHILTKNLLKSSGTIEPNQFVKQTDNSIQ